MPNKRKRRQNAAYKAQYTTYKTVGKAKKNKETKLLRHLLKHPNDKQSEERRVPVSYKRKKPHDYWYLTRQRNTSNVRKNYR